MENAAEALKLAGFTLLFVAALSIAMVTIMQAKRTSEDVLSYSDKTRYSSNMETISEKVQNKKIKISKVEKPSSLSHTTTRVRFRVDENYDEDLISNEVKMRISNVDKVKLTDNDEEEDD